MIASDFISYIHDWQLICEKENNNNNPSNESDELAHVSQRKTLSPDDI